MHVKSSEMVAGCLIAGTVALAVACADRTDEPARAIANVGGSEAGRASTHPEPQGGGESSGSDSASSGSGGTSPITEEGGTTGMGGVVDTAPADAGAAGHANEGEPDPCVEGSVSCNDRNGLLRCVGAAGYVLETTCLPGQVCAPEIGKCIARNGRCTPGEGRCLGTRAERCSQSGLAWYEVSDCQDSGQACTEGGCVDGPCEPADFVCGPGGVYRRDGCGQTALETCCACEVFRYDFDTSVQCASTSTPTAAGAKYCSGNAVAVCGSQDDPVACGSDSYCQYGACHPRPCQVGEKFCDGNTVMNCESVGPPTYDHACGPAHNCMADRGEASCRRRWCETGVAACIANQGGVCAPSGFSLTDVARDCASLGQACDVAGECAASVVDTLGDVQTGPTFTTGIVYANILEIFSDRVLTGLEVILEVPTARDIIWQVYELDAESWQATLRCEATSATPSVRFAFVKSGPLSCALEAGKVYALAVQDTASSLQNGEIGIDQSFFDKPLPVSFASLRGASSVGVSGGVPPLLLPPTLVGAFTMKVTTASP